MQVRGRFDGLRCKLGVVSTAFGSNLGSFSTATETALEATRRSHRPPKQPLEATRRSHRPPNRPLEATRRFHRPPKRPLEATRRSHRPHLCRAAPTPPRPHASPPRRVPPTLTPAGGRGWKRPLLGRGGGEQDTHAARRKRGGFLERSQNGTCGQTAFCLKRSCMHILASFVAQCAVLFGGPWALSRQSVAL